MAWDNVKILPDKPSAVRYTAERIVRLVQATLEMNERFSIAVSGGSTPQPVYEMLGTSFREHVDWERVHIFFGDERCVPPEHEESNYRMVKAALFDKLDMPPENIHRIRGEDEPHSAAAAYEAEIREFFAGEEALFDLNLLGMGEDGHTASLFPYSAALDEKEKWILAQHVETKGNLWRITLTAPAILQSANIMFLTAGSGKAQALLEVLEGDYQPDLYPSQLIARSNHEHIIWVVDEAAASLLK